MGPSQSPKGFFLMHQAMMGFVSGVILGVIAQSLLRLSSPDVWRPKYELGLLGFLLLLITAFAAHFMINGHIRLIDNDTKLQKIYGYLPSTRRKKFLQVLFWLLAVVGFGLGAAARNELFFWPQ